MNSDWQNKSDWMRSAGATSATWAVHFDAGTNLPVHVLTSLTLGAAPPETPTVDPTQRRLTPEQQEQAARAERRRLATASSGGPVMRVGDDQ